MRLNLKELSRRTDLLSSGHRLCAGCAEPIIVRQVLNIAGPETVVVNATGCLDVASTPYPYTAWRVPWLHNAFENAAATASGVEAAIRAFQRKGRSNGKIPNIIAFAGDGGSYDIGLQSLSGALERGHRFVYICLNNEAYMNTGVQRSSATPPGASTTTSPAGTVQKGKPQPRKDLTEIVAAHRIPYVAQASPHYWKDFLRKVDKALNTEGPSFLNVLAPCPKGWKSEPEVSIQLGRVAADTRVWPLYEIEQGRWKINYRPRQKKPITEWLRLQGRFAHLLKPENQELVEEMQKAVDCEWESLLAKCAA
ncbi:MAG: thiamine pyrophosphate-dependent enzyme [Dehalococcoidia bacterium]